jgi:hypothetical protein
MAATMKHAVLGHLQEPFCNCLQAIHENLSQFPGQVSIRLPRNISQGWKLICILYNCYRISETHRLSGAKEPTVNRVVVTQCHVPRNLLSIGRLWHNVTCQGNYCQQGGWRNVMCQGTYCEQGGCDTMTVTRQGTYCQQRGCDIAV